jgi:hypothetical protein
MRIFSAFLKTLSALWKKLTPPPQTISVQMQTAYLLEQSQRFEAYMRRKVEDLETPLADAYVLEVFDDFYRWCLAEAGPHEELAIARDILQAAINEGLTPVVGHGVAYVRRGPPSRHKYARGSVTEETKQKLVAMIERRNGKIELLAEDLIELMAVARRNKNGFRAVNKALDELFEAYAEGGGI